MKTSIVVALTAAVICSVGTVHATEIVDKETATQTMKAIDAASMQKKDTEYISSDTQLKSLDIHWD